MKENNLSEKKFKEDFKEQVKQYEEQGASSFKNILPQMIAVALSQDPNSYQRFVADICMDLKQFKDALALLIKGEPKYFSDTFFYNNLGYCYWELEDHESAYKAFKKSIDINSDNLSSLRGATYCSIETERNQEAVNLGKRFYEKSGNTKEAALWYATALYNLDQREELLKFIDIRQTQYGHEPNLDEIRSLVLKK